MRIKKFCSNQKPHSDVIDSNIFGSIAFYDNLRYFKLILHCSNQLFLWPLVLACHFLVSIDIAFSGPGVVGKGSSKDGEVGKFYVGNNFPT